LTLLVIFIAGYASIFLLGFQSLVVNAGNYKLAAGNSFLIAIMNTTLWGHLFKDLNWQTTLVYGLSGSLGIISSMAVHRKLSQKWRKSEQ
jgi:uncharacterized protein YebE (UPF0316 family)